MGLRDRVETIGRRFGAGQQTRPPRIHEVIMSCSCCDRPRHRQVWTEESGWQTIEGEHIPERCPGTLIWDGEFERALQLAEREHVSPPKLAEIRRLIGLQRGEEETTDL